MDDRQQLRCHRYGQSNQTSSTSHGQEALVTGMNSMTDQDLNSRMPAAPRKHLSMKGKVITIVALFILLGLMLLGLGYIQSATMNSVRSYVRGEGLWAKGQKDAVFHLQTYAQSKDDRDYHLYLESLQAPLGDKQARLTLQSDVPDLPKATEGFLAGMNHPDDIPGMIRFFLLFEHFPYMRDAISVWTEGDRLISELLALGEQLRLARVRDDPEALRRSLHELDTLNWQLAELENRFSLVLSEGARWVKNTVMLVSLALVLLLLLPVLLITRRIVKEIEETEQELRVSEDRFCSLYETDMLGIVDWHGDGRLSDANDAFLQMLGYTQRDFSDGQLNWREMTPQDHQSRDETALAEIAHKGFCLPYEKDLFHKDGHRVPVYLGAALLDGAEDTGICFVLDHSDRKQAETQLRLSATVFDASSDGILITDQHMRILTMNQAFCEMLGYSSAGLLGQTPKVFRSGMMPEGFYEEMADALNETGHWQGDVMNRKSNGEILPMRLSINAVRDSHDIPSHYVAIYADISEHKATEERLRRLAHHDFLTGLPNRSLFNDRIQQALLRAKRHGTRCAVLFFDLDRFKPVNDEYGHEIGDKLLQVIADRLRGIVRSNDTLARLGGDEFILLLEDLSGQHPVEDVAHKIIGCINQECHIDGHSIQVGCSVGISIYPDDAEDVFALIHSADIAMYHAKSAGRNQFCRYESSTAPDSEPIPQRT